MRKLFLFAFLWYFASAVKHSLKIFLTSSSGDPNIPEFVARILVNENLVGHCDRKRVEVKHDWVKELFENDPQYSELITQYCFAIEPNSLKATTNSAKQSLNQSGDVHILQRLSGCEWDDETGEVNGFNQYAYNGEEFLALDLKTLTWITPAPQAVSVKRKWDADKYGLQFNINFLHHQCPDWLNKYLHYGRSSLLRTALPTVSLLQKTPSSPVSCHATGFFPNRAVMFWRKDGEDLHEGMEHSEILPNHDGSFQMSVDLKVSPEEDWKKYQCVFQLSGVKEEIVTRLDKAVIRTNWEKPTDMTVPITAAVVVVALVLIAAAGFKVYRNKKAQCPPSDPANGSELSDPLNLET